MNRPIQDLREWLARAEAIGELVRVEQPVDRDEEMSAVTYLLAKRKPSPAVLFNQPAPADANRLGARMLWNILGPSLRRTALSLGYTYGYSRSKPDSTLPIIPVVGLRGDL